jgi:hypothetical protein
MENPKYYLVHVWGAVEPAVENPTEPFDTYEALLEVARTFVREDGNFKRGESVIFYLVETDEGGLTAGSFTDEELGFDDEEYLVEERPPQQGDSCPRCPDVLTQGENSVFCPACGWTAEAD